MKFSAPIFQLKRRAKLLARSNNMPLHKALDEVARREGFERWSLLSSQPTTVRLPEKLLDQTEAGDLLLLAGRPGQGKTRLGLQLLLAAARDGRRAALFTLEYTQAQAREIILKLEEGAAGRGEAVDIVTSDDISADFIIRHLAGAAAGTVAVIDYLQLLDQQRTKPPLSEQVLSLRDFARQSGIVLAFLAQIDRSFDPDTKKMPDVDDIRLPNQLNLRLFSKACFLHAGEESLQVVA